MTTDDVSRSISKKLSNISKARGVPYPNIYTEFLLERLLARIINVKALSSKLVFKGGYVGRRAYGSPRYTIDLDALSLTSTDDALQAKIIEAAQHDLDDGAWFRFESTIDLETQGEYPGLRFAFRAGIGEILSDPKRAQLVNFDVGVGDFVEPQSAALSPLIEGKDISWSIYPREIIVAEKLHSFLSRPLENSRSKDLFDLQFYLPSCDAELLKTSVRKTFKARGEEFPTDISITFQALSTGNLKRGWASAVSGLSDVGTFEEVFSNVVVKLKEMFSQ